MFDSPQKSPITLSLTATPGSCSSECYDGCNLASCSNSCRVAPWRCQKGICIFFSYVNYLSIVEFDKCSLKLPLVTNSYTDPAQCVVLGIYFSCAAENKIYFNFHQRFDLCLDRNYTFCEIYKLLCLSFVPATLICHLQLSNYPTSNGISRRGQDCKNRGFLLLCEQEWKILYKLKTLVTYLYKPKWAWAWPDPVQC